jgi:hypothetical protein
MILPAEYKIMQWKNGGGLTEEIARDPADGEYLWRLSRARVEREGPFSEFPGFDRLLTVVEGSGLLVNDTKIEKFETLKFAGEDKIHCRLVDGAAVDLGLIYNRQKIRAEMQLMNADQIFESCAPICFFYCASGNLQLNSAKLTAGSTLKLTGPGRFDLRANEGIGIFIQISPR